MEENEWREHGKSRKSKRERKHNKEEREEKEEGRKYHGRVHGDGLEATPSNGENEGIKCLEDAVVPSVSLDADLHQRQGLLVRVKTTQHHRVRLCTHCHTEMRERKERERREIER